MSEGFKKVPVMAWGFQNRFFLWVPTPQKNVPVMAWDFHFFCGCQPKKQGASYGMSISKPYFFGGVPTQKIGASYGIEISKPYYYLVVFPKNGASYGMESALFLFEGLPKKRLPFLAWNLHQKMCQLWHAFAPYLFSFGGFPEKMCASYGMETYSLIFI